MSTSLPVVYLVTKFYIVEVGVRAYFSVLMSTSLPVVGPRSKLSASLFFLCDCFLLEPRWRNAVRIDRRNGKNGYSWLRASIIHVPYLPLLTGSVAIYPSGSQLTAAVLLNWAICTRQEVYRASDVSSTEQCPAPSGEANV